MIATGTGIAPFIGIIEDKKMNKNWNKLRLIFGIRNSKNQYPMQNFLMESISDKNLNKFHLATSREGKK